MYKGSGFPNLLINSIEALIQFSASNERPFDYSDSSSMLIMILFEMVAILTNDKLYEQARETFRDKVNLQTSYPILTDPSVDIEQLFLRVIFMNICM